MDSLDLYCAYKPLKKYVQKGSQEFSKPFIFGNQCYVVSEQLVRNVQDTLAISIGMLTPSGEVMLISPTHHSTLFTVLLNHALDDKPEQATCSTATTQTPVTTTPATRTNEPMSSSLPNNYQSFVSSTSQPHMEFRQPTWGARNIINTDIQFPHCSKATSCSELHNTYADKPLDLSFHRHREWSTSNLQAFDAPRASNLNQCPFCRRLGARQQVKLRKLIFENDFPNEYDA